MFLFLMIFVGFSGNLFGLPLLGVNYWYFEPLTPSQKELVVRAFQHLHLDIVRIGGLWYDAHGIDESVLKSFFEFCEALDATPLVQVPFNRYDVDKAREFVKRVKTLWPREIWWSIGNEMDIYTDLWKNRVFSWIEPMSMREAFNRFDEFLKLLEDSGASTIFAPDYSWKWRPWWKRHDWISPFLERFSDRISILAVHRYPFDEAGSIKQIMDDVEAFTEEMSRLRRVFPQHPISLTEVNLTWNWEYKGRFDGQSYWAGLWFIAIYGRAAYLGLHSVLFWSAVNDKTLSLVTVKGSQIELHPTYYALKFWSDVEGELTKHELSKTLDYYVFESHDSRIVVIVNKSPKEMIVDVDENISLPVRSFTAVKLTIDRKSGTIRRKEIFSQQNLLQR